MFHTYIELGGGHYMDEKVTFVEGLGLLWGVLKGPKIPVKPFKKCPKAPSMKKMPIQCMYTFYFVTF